MWPGLTGIAAHADYCIERASCINIFLGAAVTCSPVFYFSAYVALFFSRRAQISGRGEGPARPSASHVAPAGRQLSCEILCLLLFWPSPFLFTPLLVDDDECERVCACMHGRRVSECARVRVRVRMRVRVRVCAPISHLTCIRVDA